MGIAQEYVDGLKEAYYEIGGEKQWNHFEEEMIFRDGENI